MGAIFFLFLLVVVLAGCSGDAEQPVQTTTLVISGPDEATAKEEIEVRRFEVTPETVRRGQAVTVNIELAKPASSRKLAIDWHAPDGWVVAHEAIDAGRTRIAETAPVDDFERAGRYRAVLRSGLDPVAEDTLTVTE